jgi:hypothetical protein
LPSSAGGDRRSGVPPGPLSPRRAAELAGRSASGKGSKGKGYSREGSDGTPSMGSSFSDLDGMWHTRSRSVCLWYTLLIFLLGRFF